jgi:nucleotide-binding universal stress UspA family protein
MYRRILVATDGSRLSDKAVTHAVHLARAVGAELVAFHASPDYRFSSLAEGTVRNIVSRADYEAAAAKEAQKFLDDVQREAQAAGVECTTAHEVAVSPWEAILKAARKSKAEAIVMASHGRHGLSALLLGSETQKVLAHSKLPVTVVR